MQQNATSYPLSVIFDRARTLEDLKRLPTATKSHLLLARLARIGATDQNALSKSNLMLAPDHYQLAFGYSAGENAAVRQHLLGSPWTRIVTDGLLADVNGHGFFSITDDGRAYLESDEGFAVITGENSRLAAIGERARKVFELNVGGIYERSIQSVSDFRDQNLKEGIASGGKYLRKTADLISNDFQNIEQAFIEGYLRPFAGQRPSDEEKSWLLLKIGETVDREADRVKGLFASLANSFVGASSAQSSPYVTMYDQLAQKTKGRLHTAVDLLEHGERERRTVQSEGRQKQSQRQAWLPPQWEVVRQLSEGGQGWTYIVKRTSEGDGQPFVFKRLKNKNKADRFVAEIKALEAISHPSILSIVESGEADDKPYYIAEYCEQGDLSNWNAAGRTLLDRLKLFRQIVGAISAAHSKGIIHRDLKPFNILMRANGVLAVGDFGLCIHLNDLDGRFTSLNEPVGPRNYIAPELEDGRVEDPEPSADVYSLGKLLYFILSGKSFSREKHRLPQFDLLHPEAGTAEVGLHFVYDLLDNTIVAEPKARYKDALALSDALNEVVMKIEGQANVLDMRVPQRCIYCRDGVYRVMGSTSPDQHNLKIVCSKCGNFQEFVNQNNQAGAWWTKT